MKFSQVAEPGAGFRLADHQGELLVIEPLEAQEKIPTAYGDASAIRANVYAIESGEEYPDTLLFAKIVQSQLRKSIGETVLARVGKGRAKPGQDAPWVLEPATPADQKAAARWAAQKAAGALDTDATDEAPF